MLERIEDLPPGVYGLAASGKVTKEDYERSLGPLLEDARAAGGDIRFLYHFKPGFEGFTPAAAWEDARVGLQHMRRFKRCAIVSDVEWVRQSTLLVGALLPCPVRVYGNDDLEGAVAWLALPIESASVAHRLIPDPGVVVLEVEGPLHAEDFDALALTIDPWIEAHGPLRGMVIHTRSFPGWEDPGSLLRHMQFVRDHHRAIRKVALVADGPIAEHGPRLAEHFVAAEIKHFDYDAMQDAIAWASSSGRAEAHS